jgi:hypothetical protein
LVRIDPFGTVYRRAGPRDGDTYEEKYEYDVLRILEALSRLPPGDRSPALIRDAIFRTLEDNTYGNLHGGVGTQERYADLATQVSNVLLAPAPPDTQRPSPYRPGTS